LIVYLLPGEGVIPITDSLEMLGMDSSPRGETSEILHSESQSSISHSTKVNSYNHNSSSLAMTQTSSNGTTTVDNMNRGSFSSQTNFEIVPHIKSGMEQYYPEEDEEDEDGDKFNANRNAFLHRHASKRTIYPNGDMYIGEMKDGMRYGKGKLIYAHQGE
jgi:hypothetical protein